MSMKAFHALLTLVLGLAVGIVWLRAFWNNARIAPAAVVAAPVAAGLLGLGHWIAYDFSLQHWAGDFSLLQACLTSSSRLYFWPGAGLRRSDQVFCPNRRESSAEIFNLVAFEPLAVVRATGHLR